jgi:hypothetical protein
VAATVGATLSAVVFPARHTNLGPFVASNGTYWYFGQDSVSAPLVCAMKATAPMTSFSKQSTKSYTTAFEAMACYQVGDVIHIATQISTGAVYYNSWDMVAQTWGLTTSELAVAAASQPPTTNATFVDLVVRGNGEVVFVYCAGQTAMSSTFNMVFYRRRTGVATYQTAVKVDNAGSVNWTGGVAALGASDRVHFFLSSATASDGYQRTLTQANALETFPAAFDTTMALLGNNFAQAIAYSDAGTTRIRTIYSDQNVFPSIAKADSSDAPTVSVDAAIAAAGGDAGPGTMPTMTLNNDGTTLHALWVDGITFDLMHDSSTGGGGAWGTDTNELAGTINHITANVYDRSGTKLAMVLDDAGTIKYAEIALAAGPPTITMDAAGGTLAGLPLTLDVPTPAATSLLWNHYQPTLTKLTSR